MAKAIMAVFSNPASPEREDEYNTWYDQVHIKDLLSLPGIGSATRYRVADAEHRYVALYELHDSVEAVVSQLGCLSTEVSPALDLAGTRTYFWEPVDQS
ncbi:hypothetical protein ACWEPC_29720 [Nonomuraea sp. NPDC004297]